ncbi:unnamed protein product [Auanema sp. JU1783]|nr:unnamed protein product [Auanema sp. JU1783]
MQSSSEAQVSVNQFYTNSESLAQHTVAYTDDDENALMLKKLNATEIREFFEIDETIEWIKRQSLTRLALQFPDSFLPYSALVSNLLEEATEVKTFILADTSYKSCCVDQVAAAHANCDSIVHYGEACLSNIDSSMNIRFVLGRIPCDENRVISLISKELKEATTDYVILSETHYDHCLEDIAKLLRVDTTSNVTVMHTILSDEELDEHHMKVLGRNVPNSFLDLESYSAIFIGSPSSSFLALWLLTYPQCNGLAVYNPQNDTYDEPRPSSLKLLRKRLFLIEKFKDASTIGIVVNCVGLRKDQDAINRLMQLAKGVGKRAYILTVGKINVPKLANFAAEVDAYVLLSCPFGVVLDTSEFYRPIVSMFEAEVAFNPNCNWSAYKGWTAEFETFLKDEIGERDPEETDVSLITGTIRNVNVSSTTGSQDVVLHSAGDNFKQRTWRGLDDSMQTDESTAIQDGRRGIASSYVNEKTL